MRARAARTAVWFNRPAKRVTVAVLFLLACALAGFSAYLYAHQRSDQRANTKALCAFRDDVQRRYDSGVAFLKTHPQGFAGISAGTIRVSLQNEQSTLKALKPLIC